MKAYAIKDPKGKIIPWYISFFAGQTKKRFLRDRTINQPWKWFYKLGYRCVPVEINEIKK